MRIFDDIGGAFSMGTIGGSLVYGIIGFRNAAQGQRMRTAYRSALVRAPITGGQFAAWGGVFSTIDCTLVKMRGTEDSYNAIIAGAATGGLLTMRQGPMTMAISACVGGILLAMIEGVGALMTRMNANQFDPTIAAQMEDPQALGMKPSSSSSYGASPSDETGFMSWLPGVTPNPAPPPPAPLELDINMGTKPPTPGGGVSQSPYPTGSAPSPDSGNSGSGWISWLIPGGSVSQTA